MMFHLNGISGFNLPESACLELFLSNVYAQPRQRLVFAAAFSRENRGARPQKPYGILLVAITGHLMTYRSIHGALFYLRS